jgi:hypothetical protein
VGDAARGGEQQRRRTRAHACWRFETRGMSRRICKAGPMQLIRITRDEASLTFMQAPPPCWATSAAWYASPRSYTLATRRWYNLSQHCWPNDVVRRSNVSTIHAQGIRPSGHTQPPAAQLVQTECVLVSTVHSGSAYSWRHPPSRVLYHMDARVPLLAAATRRLPQHALSTNCRAYMYMWSLARWVSSL